MTTYEIQTEWLPGNNQLWVSFKSESDGFVFQYSTLAEAEIELERMQIQDPNRKYRVIKKEI
jgi:hypothetical protein